jgi:pimeloyl-ACP methyl ester carboxylesterase
MPTWSIVDSRVWKAQIGYLSRDFDVITFDGRGCGKSDRPAEARYYAEPHPTDRHRASAGRPVGMTSRRVRGLRDPAGQPDQHRDLDPEGVQDRDRIPIGELR